MTEHIYQIFDKIFKKILTLSETAVINLINGLFGTDYPQNSTISYHWTEFEDEDIFFMKFLPLISWKSLWKN